MHTFFRVPSDKPFRRLQGDRGELVSTGRKGVYGNAQSRIEHSAQVGSILIYNGDGCGGSHVKKDDRFRVLSDSGNRLSNQVAAQFAGIVGTDV